MADHKNHHYVPKCVLRRFSPDASRRSINVFNVRRGIFIPKCALKSQASKDYMYGKDGELERILAKIETDYGVVVDRVINGASDREEDLEFLRFFLYLQYRRTEMAVKDLDAAYRALHTSVFEDQPDPNPPTQLMLTIDSLRQCFETVMYIADLKTRIIQNESRVEFVLSDDPSVMTNKFAVARLGDPGFGVSSSGVMFFMPVSPRHCVICYDGGVYTVPSLTDGRLVLRNDGDVDAVNELQFLKAGQNLYFRNWEQRTHIQEQADLLGIRERPLGPVVSFFVRDADSNGREIYRKGTREEGKAARSALLQFSFKQPTPSRWLPQIKFRSTPKTFSNGTAIGHVRKREWLRR